MPEKPGGALPVMELSVEAGPQPQTLSPPSAPQNHSSCSVAQMDLQTGQCMPLMLTPSSTGEIYDTLPEISETLTPFPSSLST